MVSKFINSFFFEFLFIFRNILQFKFLIRNIELISSRFFIIIEKLIPILRLTFLKIFILKFFCLHFFDRIPRDFKVLEFFDAGLQ